MNTHPTYLLPESDQTQVGGESDRLLVSGAPWRGVLVDLYGSATEESGYEVDDVALKGSQVSLVEWFDRAELAALSAWCEDHLNDLRAQERADDAYDPFAPWSERPRRYRH